MRVASIDIGTNSCRLLIAEINQGQEPNLLYQTISTTRIGEGIGHPGDSLKIEAIDRTIKALAAFVTLMKEFFVEKCRVVATAAVREATNSQQLLQLTMEKTGLTIEIISGEEEAWLTYLGVIKGLPEVPEEAVIIDVGGGSTEFIWASSKGRIEVVSVPLGAVRATEAGLQEAEIAHLLQPVLTRVAAVKPRHLIGTGGTATTLAAMQQEMAVYDRQRIHGSAITSQAVTAWYYRLSNATLEQRGVIPGLQPARADIILAGVTIIKRAMDQLMMPEMLVSETDLLWALLYSSRE